MQNLEESEVLIKRPIQEMPKERRQLIVSIEVPDYTQKKDALIAQHKAATGSLLAKQPPALLFNSLGREAIIAAIKRELLIRSTINVLN